MGHYRIRNTYGNTQKKVWEKLQSGQGGKDTQPDMVAIDTITYIAKKTRPAQSNFLKHPAVGSLANMKMLWVLLLVLSWVPGAPAVPAQRRSCHKRLLREHSCHSVPAGTDSLRHVHHALPHHFWEGKGCQVICYCNLNELLCCPKNRFQPVKMGMIEMEQESLTTLQKNDTFFLSKLDADHKDAIKLTLTEQFLKNV
ncbi:hypothetical protein EK904_010604 [Melospiza melodia maxima]|nr:hypothetical protein EK904_010604 [Melospiza melodia maxima]